MMQSMTREAQPPQSGGLFGMDVACGLFGMSGSFLGGRSVMFKSPGQSRRPTLQANAVRGPSPGPMTRSMSASPSRGVEVRICQLEVDVLWREGGSRATEDGDVGVVRGDQW